MVNLVARAEMIASRHQIGFCLVILCTFLAISVPVSSAGADVRKTLEVILSDEAYQREIPQLSRVQAQPLRFNFQLPEWLKLGSVSEAIIWIAALIVVISAVVYIVARATNASWLTKIMPSEETPEEGGKSRTVLSEFGSQHTFDDVERLAQDGQFGDAVHLLLLLCFESLQNRSPTARDSALTSREILEHANLPASAQTSLAFIVSVVEIGHFGGHLVERPEFDRCLEGYREIIAADLS